MDDNEEIFRKILYDQEFQDVLADYYVSQLYRRLREREAKPFDGGTDPGEP
jgi:hypothetical protein